MAYLLLVLFEHRTHWSENMNSDRHAQPQAPVPGQSRALRGFQPSSLLKNQPWGFRELQQASVCRNWRYSHSTTHSSNSEFKLWISGLDQLVNSNLFRYHFFHTLLAKSQAPNTEGPSLCSAVCINHVSAWRRLSRDLLLFAGIYCKDREERDRLFRKVDSD